jgi:hypothetical protein
VVRQVRELTAEEIAWYEKKRRGGRPTDFLLNIELWDVWFEARLRGIPLRDGVKEFVEKKFIEKHGRALSPEEVEAEVPRWERRINRELPPRLRRLKSKSQIVEIIAAITKRRISEI